MFGIDLREFRVGHFVGSVLLDVFKGHGARHFDLIVGRHFRHDLDEHGLRRRVIQERADFGFGGAVGRLGVGGGA